jgi:uncharacterized protein (TIGR03067 family)
MTPTVLVTLAVVHSAPVLTDVPRLVGEWRGEGPFGRGTLVITPNGTCLEKSPGRLRAATYRVNPRERPAEIDFWDPGAEAPRRGIYKISGDNLTVCWTQDQGDARPAGFEVRGVGTEILHLTRIARVASPTWKKELARLTPWANKLFTGSPEAPPPVIVRDAGVLPKGETTTVRVKLTNVYTVPLKVESPRPVSERVPRVRGPDGLDPKQTGFFEVGIDTRGLDGESAVRITVALLGLDPKSGDLGEDPKTGRLFISLAEVVIRFESR